MPSGPTHLKMMVTTVNKYLIVYIDQRTGMKAKTIRGGDKAADAIYRFRRRFKNERLVEVLLLNGHK